MMLLGPLWQSVSARYSSLIKSVYTTVDEYDDYNIMTFWGSQVLGVPSSNSDVDVVAELRGRLEEAGLVATSSSMMTLSPMMTSSPTQQDDVIAAAVAAEAAKHESTIAELKSTNESLKAKFKTLYKASQDAKQRHAKDVTKLQKTVAELQKRAREQQTAEVEKTGGQTTTGGDVSGEVSATSADSRSGVVLPPVNVASPQSRVSLTNPQATSAGDHHHHQNSAVRLSAAQAPALPVSMPPLALPRNSPTTTPRANPPTTAIVLPSLASDTSAYQNINDQPPNSLRSQVCLVCLSALQQLTRKHGCTVKQANIFLIDRKFGDFFYIKSNSLRFMNFTTYS